MDLSLKLLNYYESKNPELRNLQILDLVNLVFKHLRGSLYCLVMLSYLMVTGLMQLITIQGGYRGYFLNFFLYVLGVRRQLNLTYRGYNVIRLMLGLMGLVFSIYFGSTLVESYYVLSKGYFKIKLLKNVLSDCTKDVLNRPYEQFKKLGHLSLSQRALLKELEERVLNSVQGIFQSNLNKSYGVFALLSFSFIIYFRPLLSLVINAIVSFNRLTLVFNLFVSVTFSILVFGIYYSLKTLLLRNKNKLQRDFYSKEQKYYSFIDDTYSKTINTLNLGLEPYISNLKRQTESEYVQVLEPYYRSKQQLFSLDFLVELIYTRAVFLELLIYVASILFMRLIRVTPLTSLIFPTITLFNYLGQSYVDLKTKNLDLEYDTQRIFEIIHP